MISFVVGLVLGGMLGMALICLIIASKDDEEE